MSGYRLRIVFIVSLVILGVLLAFTMFRPMVTGKEYSVVGRESVIQGEDQWIIQFDIVNREEKDMTYTMIWSSGGETYTEKVVVGDGRIYSHIRHVYLETVKEGRVDLTIYEEGEAIPFEQVTYYLP